MEVAWEAAGLGARDAAGMRAVGGGPGRPL